MRRQLYFDGPENLFAAVDTALNNPTVGIVVVRDMVSSVYIEKMAEISDNVKIEDDNRERLLYDDVPELEAIDLFVGEWWRRNGYSDFRLANSRMEFSGVYTGKTDTHLDDEKSPSYGPLTVSIGALGASTIYGEKRGSRTINPNRQYNPDSYSVWHEKVKNLSRPLKDKVLQRPRDAVFIAAHPSAAAHAVVIHREPRKAYLYDYHIERTS